MERTIEEIRTDYVDDQNLRHIDLYFVETEQGETVALFDQDTGKTIWIKNNEWRWNKRVSAAVLDIQEEYRKPKHRSPSKPTGDHARLFEQNPVKMEHLFKRRMARILANELERSMGGG